MSAIAEGQFRQSLRLVLKSVSTNGERERLQRRYGRLKSRMESGDLDERRRHNFRYSRLFGHPEHQFNFFSHQIGGARSKDHEPSFQFRLWTAPGTKI